MAIDFTKLGDSNAVDDLLHPRKIFNALPKKADKFQYPRDVQGEVWSSWFERRNEKTLIMKMNTGSGKTIVGLLILKSCLNEKKGPAVYVVPDKYLTKQVISEAQQLGIEVTDDPDSPRFLSGRSILIVNIYKLVNGLSIFGVGDRGRKIKIGSLIIDDAHACFNTIEEQCTISISDSNESFVPMYCCFKDSLKQQCESTATEIEVKVPNAFLQVPFWDWQAKTSDVAQILLKNRENDEIKFPWPLLKETLSLCRCVISASKIEISPHCIPIHMIPSITYADRKIFMTATLSDESVLATHFGITEDLTKPAIVPASAGDIGERMVLLPQVLNNKIQDEEIKGFCKQVSKRINVVVIVPSDSRANFWKDQANLVLTKDNINEGIENLKKGHLGLVILINRYDGIDLPDDACRLLVIDGLPDVRHLIDEVKQNILMDSKNVSRQLIQKIEQGMGRGVRSNKDYCAVFLMGKKLIRKLYADKGRDMFSPGTRAQLDISDKLSDQIQGKEFKEIVSVVDYCLNRNDKWVNINKGILADLVYSNKNNIDDMSLCQRKAYDFILCSNYDDAIEVLQNLSNITQNPSDKSYLLQCLAEYVNFKDKSLAQKILKSAASYNNSILKPLEGIAYHKLDSNTMDQAKNCSNFLTRQAEDPNCIVIEVNDILDSLKFGVTTANKFENSFNKIANYIGFHSQRPENEAGKGPDVLWELGNKDYFIIECKNGVTTETICKHDCNQLNGSIVWFNNKYDDTCKYTPILIHPSNKFESACSPNKKIKILNVEKLELLLKSISSFIASICSDNDIHDIDVIRKKLVSYKLRKEDILKNYLINFHVK